MMVCRFPVPSQKFPVSVRAAVLLPGSVWRQYLTLIAEVSAIDKRIHAWHRSCEESRRLEEIPGIGPIVATTLVAEIGNWRCSYVRKFLPRRRPHVTQSGHALPVAACGAEAAT